jgi:hypothetical protein
MRSPSAEAERALATAARAVPRAEDAFEKAVTRLEAARAATVDAKKARVQEFADAALTGRGTGASKARSARSNEADAEDEVEAAQSALEAVRAQVAHLEEVAMQARWAVVVAADAVLRGGALGVLERARELAAQLQSQHAVLALLRNSESGADDPRHVVPLNHPYSMSTRRERKEAFAEVGGAITRHLEGRDHDELEHVDLRTAWVEYRRRLMDDADAPLPAVG